MNPAWEVRYHRPLKKYMLYLDGGRDALDGQPLYFATPLLAEETQLWCKGKREELAKMLRGRGIPIPFEEPAREGRLSRLLRFLFRCFRGR